MIALLNQQQRFVVNPFNRINHQTANLDKVFKLSFGNPVRLKEILDFVSDPQNAIRFARNREVFAMLSQKFPLQENERVVCLENDIEIGDEILVIRSDGPSIIPTLPLWDINYSFPVVVL